MKMKYNMHTAQKRNMTWTLIFTSALRKSDIHYLQSYSHSFVVIISFVDKRAMLFQNSLFCGNHDAVENAAIIYTFMGCCKLAQVDVRKWLNYFFTHIHDYDEDCSRDLLELLPHNLKQKDIL